MENKQKIIDYFFASQNIQLTEFHRQEAYHHGILIVDPREKSNLVCKHQIIQFDFDQDKSTENNLFAKAFFIYENGKKNGMIFNNDFFIEQMKLGTKCVEALDRMGIRHYYPVICFNIEMDISKNTILVDSCYQRINIINVSGHSSYLLEDVVKDIITNRLSSWEVNTKETSLSDLIDMFLMADI